MQQPGQHWWLAKFDINHHLSLRSCTALVNIGTLATCTSLRSLDILDTQMQSVNWRQLGTFSQLQSLDLSYNSWLGEWPLGVTLPSLTALNLCQCETLRNVDELGICTNLQLLDLTGSNMVFNASILLLRAAVAGLNVVR